MNFYLSFSDLRLIDDWQDEIEIDNPSRYLEILWGNGINITKPFETVLCTHRNLQNQIVECYRIEAEERTDRAWLQSGAASTNAYIDSTNDASFKDYLRDMNSQNDNKHYQDALNKIKNSKD